ncbi:MAG: hypothetical protein EP347_05565 [Alphaproteobacteria bacterium]|nr:MAG: hypothetical protein EP347_05565 [Alphaproteobacteria bacterium]
MSRVVPEDRHSDFYFSVGDAQLETEIKASVVIDAFGKIAISYDMEHHFRDTYDWEVNLSTDLVRMIPNVVVVSDELGRVAVEAGLASEFEIENDWIDLETESFDRKVREL